jgi:hypothetical protein
MFWEGSELALAIGGKSQASFDVFTREVRRVRQNLFFSHAAGKVLKDIRHSHSRSANSWLPLRLPGSMVMILL